MAAASSSARTLLGSDTARPATQLFDFQPVYVLIRCLNTGLRQSQLHRIYRSQREEHLPPLPALT